MAAGDRPIWFLGDRTDPSASAIARELPGRRTRLIAAPAELPQLRLARAAERPGLVVVHRSVLSRGDLDRLARLRDWLGKAGRIILCVGPHARAVEIERWLGVVDAAVPDAVAPATIGRFLAAAKRSEPTPPAAASAIPTIGVAVVSTNHELRATLAALLRAHRFTVAERAELEATPPAPNAAIASVSAPRTVTLWDVPALEPGWPDRLRRASAAGLGPVVVLIGLLDARNARSAHDAGAALALDLPVDAADLVEAVHRAARTRRDPAHPTPPTPRQPSRSRRRTAGRPAND